MEEKIINYWNWAKRQLDFVGIFNAFKAYSEKGDKTMAKDFLKQFENDIERLILVGRKMRQEFYNKLK